MKLAETGFGTCRGAKPADKNGSGNPDPSRCKNFGQIRHSPKTQCWMVTKHGRRYWEWLADTEWFGLNHVPDTDGCPFRDRAYQLMRNAVLARALMVEAGAEWTEVAVCVHAGNHAAHQLKYPVAGAIDAVDAARSIAPKAGFQPLSPSAIVSSIEVSDPSCSEWARWMRARYDMMALNRRGSLKASLFHEAKLPYSCERFNRHCYNCRWLTWFDTKAIFR